MIYAHKSGVGRSVSADEPAFAGATGLLLALPCPSASGGPRNPGRRMQNCVGSGISR